MNEALLEKLEQVTYVGRTNGQGITTISCPFHEDRTPSAWVGDTHWGCYSCERKGTLKQLARQLGTSYEVTPEELEAMKERKRKRQVERHRAAEKYERAIAHWWRQEDCELDAKGTWYLETFRSVSPTFAERYGFRSRGPGRFSGVKQSYPWTVFGVPPHFRRWGVLVIPYWISTRQRSPSSLRFRAIGHPANMDFTGVAKAFTPRPLRYYSMRNAPSYLFNERAFHQESELAVTEGELDALALMEAGWPAVALGGKSINWARLGDLARDLGIRRLILVPDNEPGAIKSFEQNGRRHLKAVRWELHAPSGKDVDEARKREGQLAWTS